jgi:hypothetical protein
MLHVVIDKITYYYTMTKDPIIKTPFGLVYDTDRLQQVLGSKPFDKWTREVTKAQHVACCMERTHFRANGCAVHGNFETGIEIS